MQKGLPHDSSSGSGPNTAWADREALRDVIRGSIVESEPRGDGARGERDSGDVG